MELTDAQRRAASAEAPLLIEGPPGSGRTTALLARFLRLLDMGVEPGRILFLARSGDAARRVRRKLILDSGRSMAEPLVITPLGLAALELRRIEDRPVRVLTQGESRAFIGRMLEDEDDSDWPRFPRDVRELPGFGDALAGFCREAQRRRLDASGLADRLASAGRASWTPAARFLERYLSRLDAQGAVDQAGAVARLALSSAALGSRFDAILVDDAEAAAPSLEDLLRTLDPDGVKTTVAWSDTLATSRSPHGVRDWLAGSTIALEGVVRSHGHLAAMVVAITAGGKVEAGEGVEVRVCPQLLEEVEEVAEVLRGEAWSGTPYDQMAVIGRGDALEAVERAIVNRGIPARRAFAEPLPGNWIVEPMLAALELEALERPPPVDRLCYELWLRGPHLVEARAAALRGEAWAHAALDAALALVEASQGFVDRRPGGSVAEFLESVRAGEGGVGAATRRHAVTLHTPGDAGGREYEVVALLGCTDSVFPGGRAGFGLFDLRVLDGGPVAAARAEVADGRARFARAIASARRRVVITASVDVRGRARLSRFVASAPSAALTGSDHVSAKARRIASDPELAAPRRLGAALYLVRSGEDPARWWGTREWTRGPSVPVGELSHSSISAYDTCPLAWLYEHGLHLRGEVSHYATQGILLHSLLEDFTNGKLTREELPGAWEQRFDPSAYPSAPVARQFLKDGREALEAFLEWPGKDREVVSSEHKFHVEIAGVKVTGRVDRVERLADGLIRVVDYKTGKVPPAKDEDRTLRQLRLYLVAAERDPELQALGRPYDAALWYLTSSGVKTIPAKPEKGVAGEVEAMVSEAAEGMAAGRFVPKPSYQVCRTCDYRHLCPAQPEGKELLA